MCRNWRVFGPTQEHSDGDADFYKTTSRLNEQYPGWDEQEQGRLGQEGADQGRPRGFSTRGSVLLANERAEYGLSAKQIRALGLTGVASPDPMTLSSRNYLRGEKYLPEQFGYTANAVSMASSGPGHGVVRGSRTSRSSQGARAAIGDYQTYPEGRPVFLPEAERYGTPPDLPSLLLQQRVIYISMPFLPSVTELVVAQCYYLDFDDRNRKKPIYVYLNSSGCMNDKGQAISADNEFYAMWSALGFTRAPLYTGVTWKAQNQAAILLAAGQKGHRYTFPHAKISTAPPVLNRVFGQTVDAQLQANELVYATKYYAAIMARATGKPLDVCQEEYLSRKRYFDVPSACEEGIIDKVVPGFFLNRFRKMKKDMFGEKQMIMKEKPRFRFKRQEDVSE